METILPKKTNQENPLALDDDHYAALAADPAITQFPQGTTYDTIASASIGITASGSLSARGIAISSSNNESGTYPNNFTTNYSNIESKSQQPQSVLTNAGSNAAQGADVLVTNENSDWINKKWRPAMGWMYMGVCVCDFTIFPILWSVLQALNHGQVTSQWQPLTLQGAGLFHIAMGAVLGIAAYGRTKEKVTGTA
jgi:hypothetical protein